MLPVISSYVVTFKLCKAILTIITTPSFCSYRFLSVLSVLSGEIDSRGVAYYINLNLKGNSFQAMHNCFFVFHFDFWRHFRTESLTEKKGWISFGFR